MRLHCYPITTSCGVVPANELNAKKARHSRLLVSLEYLVISLGSLDSNKRERV